MRRKRGLLLAAITVGALAASPGVASADVGDVNFGDAPPQYDSVDYQYFTLSSNNQLAQTGPKVGFFVRYQCTAGESFGVAAYVDQADSDEGGPPEGGGGAQAGCNGSDQYVFVIAERSQAPFFNSNTFLFVEGVGFSLDGHNQLTDLDYSSSTLDPYTQGGATSNGSNEAPRDSSRGDEEHATRRGR